MKTLKASVRFSLSLWTATCILLSAWAGLHAQGIFPADDAAILAGARLSDGKVLVWVDLPADADFSALGKQLESLGATALNLAPEGRLQMALPPAALPSVRQISRLKLSPTKPVPSRPVAKQEVQKAPGLGARPPTPEEQRYLQTRSVKVSRVAPTVLAIQRASLQRAGQLPAAVDNSRSKYFPPIRSQGTNGSCTAWAACYYWNTYTQCKDEDLAVSDGTGNDVDGNDAYINSPAFMYPLTNNGKDEGASTEFVVQRLNEIGCCSLSFKPYSESDWTSWPSEMAWADAMQRRTAGPKVQHFGSHNGASDSDLADMKQHLANGNILVTWTYVYDNWHPNLLNDSEYGIDNGVLFSHAGQNPVRNRDGSRGSHAMTIVGYDDNRAYTDNGATKHGAFLIANSWGADWGTYNSSGTGTRGFMWVAYDYFKADNGCFGVGYFNEDRPRYRSILWAVAGLNHSERGRLSFTGGIGDRQNPAWKSPFLLHENGGNSLGLTDSTRVVIDLSDGLPFVADYGNMKLFVQCNVSGSASANGTITSAEFVSLSGGGIKHATSSDPIVTISPGQTGYATATISTIEKQTPTLSNPRVSPPSGTTATEFEFLVDYEDADGDPPHPGNMQLYLPGGRTESMTLKSGAPAHGTYSFKTKLASGSYNFCFLFADTSMNTVTTPWRSGPTVFADGNAAINIVIQCTRISSDLRLKYSVNGGSWMDIPITKPILDPILVPAGSAVAFEANVASPNYTYREWEGFDKGVRFGGSTSMSWQVTLGTGTTVVGLNVFYGYAPQHFSINGTVLLGNGSPVPRGVDLVLTSSEQTVTNHTDNGNWTFSGVVGGVSVTITPKANGFTFSPASLVFNNLNEIKSGQAVTAYSSDDFAPTTQLTAYPPSVAINSAISFTWMGQDNVSAPANLQYQYKLDGVDSAWSAWTSATTGSYSLPNGCYTFWVRNKDQAGNTNQAPVSYSFVMNASPKVISAVRNTRSVWSSRVTLQMPPGSAHPTNIFVLLPEHSGMSDSDLVPVRIHEADQLNPSGANVIIASQIGLPASITRTTKGWLTSLPDNLSSGQTASYDIVWGKIKYFGWNEWVDVSRNLPNGGAVQSAYLSDDYRLWRLATKNVQYGGNVGETKAWVFMNVSDLAGPVVPETVVRHQYGQPFNGSLGYSIIWNYGQILKTDARVCLFWNDNKDAWDGTRNYYYRRFGAQFFDLGGTMNNTYDSQYINRNHIGFPNTPIRNRLWLVGSVASTNTASPSSAWFHVLDAYGNELIPKTDFDSLQNSNGSDLWLTEVSCFGTNTILVWTRYWYTASGRDRQEIAYQVRNDDGQLVRATASFTPLLPDGDNNSDTYGDHLLLADKDGKLWISYLHWRSGQPTEFFYVIIGSDGNIWKGPVETSAQRNFNFCDRDGLIWASQDGQFFGLNANDTTNVPPRPETWTPNQRLDQVAASVSADGYRLYDRWTPQLVEIQVPADAKLTKMAVFDLNLWNNDLHPANVMIKNGADTVWSQSGKFTGQAEVDVSNSLKEGENIVTVTQNDLLGGQVLMTFPYVFTHTIRSTAEAHGWISPAGPVMVNHGTNQAFTITPEQNYHVAEVLVDGDSVGAVTNYSFTNVMQDHTINAAFAENIEPPVITVQPQGQTNITGETTSFRVEATGTGPLGYQWKLDGTSLAGATNATLILANVQARDAGIYTVVVSNAAGSVTSTEARLTVLVPPTITLQPQSLTVTNGTTAQFRVTASGTEPLTYQWRHNGADLPWATNAVLIIANAQPGNAGSYAAVVSNAAGSVTCAEAYLTVLVPPTITLQPQSATVTNGATAQFSVTANGTQPLAFQWIKDESAVNGETNSLLVLPNVQSVDEGRYWAVVSNAAGSVTSSVASLTLLATNSIAVSDFPPYYTNGTPFTVKITVRVASGVFAYAVLEQPPAGWQVTNVSDRGIIAFGKVMWAFNDSKTRTLTYMVTPPSGAYGTNYFVGSANFNATTDKPITGQRQCVEWENPDTPRLSIETVQMFEIQYSKLILEGAVGRTYKIQMASDLGQTMQWTEVWADTLTDSPHVWLDLESSGESTRFYRAVLAP